ncbi:nucleoside hydrolase [candidate division KSB1 bacterium]|nr:nucleoside hydrolase [candidate division KSB1 bacterium]
MMQPIRMVLDTDTYNEIDDQFALVYALCSCEKFKVEAIYAAPFSNERSTGPGDGMEKSYEEILRLLELLRISSNGFVYRGSTRYLSDVPESSPAVVDLINRALSSPQDSPLYVVSIGAITNIASALLIEPKIMHKIVVVWLGGNLPCLPHTNEFNLKQDVAAARHIFDCGVSLVHVPCIGVASHLLTTKAELSEHLAGRNAVCDFLYQRFCEYSDDHFAWGKEIWDIAPIAWLLDESWAPSRLMPSPRLRGEWDMKKGGHLYFEPAPERHLIRQVWYVQRNPIFRDLFTKLKALPF